MARRRLLEGVASVLAAGLLPALLACPGNRDAGTGQPRYGGAGGETSLRDPVDDGRRCPSSPEYVEESLDTSGNNVADVRKVYRVEGEGADRRQILLCREMDLNRDGRKDIFRFYSEQGRPLREMVDMNFDGTIDSITFFEEGRIVRQEVDRDNDGRPDEIRLYTRGQLTRVERDDSRDGRVDVWEHWDGGRLLRIGYDVDGDGVADFWHRAPPAPDETVPEPTPGLAATTD